MSQIYKNTFAAGIIGTAIATGYNAIQTKTFNFKDTHGALVYSNAAINFIEMFANKCLSTKTEAACDNVFFSPTQVYFPNCTIVREEFSYVDTIAKTISIAIAGMTFIPTVGDFIKNNDLVFTVVPGVLAFIGDQANDLFDLGLVYERGVIEDYSGQYTAYEL